MHLHDLLNDRLSPAAEGAEATAKGHQELHLQWEEGRRVVTIDNGTISKLSVRRRGEESEIGAGITCLYTGGGRSDGADDYVIMEDSG
jgi:hypothetical protein